jgi:hypothetical protein
VLSFEFTACASRIRLLEGVHWYTNVHSMFLNCALTGAHEQFAIEVMSSWAQTVLA